MSISRKAKGVGVILTVMALAGCATQYSGAPIATNFPNSEQQKLQAASHWQVIATNTAQTLIAHLPTQNDRYFVESNSIDSEFNHAVENQLRTSLVNSGKMVAKYPANVLHVTVDTQVVPFTHDGLKPQFTGAPTLLALGVWTVMPVAGRALASGWTLSSALRATAGAATIAAGGVDAYDWFGSKYAGNIPKTEIIVTVSVSDTADYLARTTNVYYVNDSDQALYLSRSAPTIYVVGGK